MLTAGRYHYSVLWSFSFWVIAFMTFSYDERIYLQTFLKALRNSLTFSEIFVLLSIWYCYFKTFFHGISTGNHMFKKEIWDNDYNWTRTQNQLVLKRTLNHLAKWLSVRFKIKTKFIKFCTKFQIKQAKALQTKCISCCCAEGCKGSNYATNKPWQKIPKTFLKGFYFIWLRFKIQKQN